MKIDKAKKIAEKYLEMLKPFTVRCEIAGSIRRERQEVKDIELVCIPKTVKVQEGMFDEKEIRDSGFINLVNSFARIRGNAEGKYAQIILPKQEDTDETINLDLFITTAEQWGVIFMIRTGSADFSRRMVTEIKQRGFFVKDGFLWNQSTNSKIPCYEEKEFFSFTGLEYLEPHLRIF